MKIRTDFPYPIRTIPHTWITLRDGTRLAARIWLPQDAEAHPVPGILEYIPYRKNDGTAERDAIRHPYIAGHGYACVRVDMRGSGDSDGILYDEYLPQEQEDALDVIVWMAAQPWCTGDVGIIGKSWGGFNGLQIAARKPPALKAIITVYSTDDRYADDVHYMGGCMLGAEMLPWASTMFAYNARPPDPQIVGEAWRDIWLARMAQTPPYVEEWLRHQTRDAFWQQGSVCENFADIECAVYAIGGWNDGYSNAVFRLLEGLSCPAKGLIGPWSHQYPESATHPGPAIGFHQECLRWWDYWLKGVETGIMDEPPLRVWMQEHVTPATTHTHWPGRWVAEAHCPPRAPRGQPLYLTTTGLADAPGVPGQRAAHSIQTHGLAAGAWCPFGVPGELPGDQRVEDGLALCFDSNPATQTTEILGFPAVTVTVVANQPNALLAVRLCAVAPDGSSLLLTRGLLNLTHRESHEDPSPLTPGQPYPVTVRLNATAYSLPPGHRWRVALAPAYWPHAWPSPAPVTLTFFLDESSRLSLPIRPPQPEDEALVPFAPSEVSQPLPIQVLRAPVAQRTFTHDVVLDKHVLRVVGDVGRIQYPASGDTQDGHILDEVAYTTFAIRAGDPLSASVQCAWTIALQRGEWRPRVETVSTMTADASHFHVTNLLDAYEGDTRIFAKSWTFSAPRYLV